MAARLIRMWFENLYQLKPGAIAPLILCGIMLGAVITVCMHKPPATGNQNVQASSGQVHAACQPTASAAFAARPSDPPADLLTHNSWANPDAEHSVKAPNAYNILVPDWGGSSYRLKTIVTQ
jgi:hypothetical protein